MVKKPEVPGQLTLTPKEDNSAEFARQAAIKLAQELARETAAEQGMEATVEIRVRRKGTT